MSKEATKWLLVIAGLAAAGLAIDTFFVRGLLKRHDTATSDISKYTRANSDLEKIVKSEGQMRARMDEIDAKLKSRKSLKVYDSLIQLAEKVGFRMDMVPVQAVKKGDYFDAQFKGVCTIGYDTVLKFLKEFSAYENFVKIESLQVAEGNSQDEFRVEFTFSMLSQTPE